MFKERTCTIKAGCTHSPRVCAVLPLTTGMVPFGLITGVTAIGMGMSPLDAMGMTLLFYSGSAQMVVLQLMQSGALPLTMGSPPW